jgi:hypothetical protein
MANSFLALVQLIFIIFLFTYKTNHCLIKFKNIYVMTRPLGSFWVVFYFCLCLFLVDFNSSQFVVLMLMLMLWWWCCCWCEFVVSCFWSQLVIIRSTFDRSRFTLMIVGTTTNGADGSSDLSLFGNWFYLRDRSRDLLY